MRKETSTDHYLSRNHSPEKAKLKRNPTWIRKWETRDIQYLTFMLSVHVLCLWAPSTFSWDAFRLAFVLYVVTGFFGIAFSYHRNLTHRGFKLPKYLEYAFAYCGFHAYQGDPILWVSTHRHHHKHADTELDPHSPLDGFWHSYITWIFNYNQLVQKGASNKNAADLTSQPFYRFLEKTMALHIVAMGVLLYMVGGFPYVVWGMGVKTVWNYFLISFVNTVAHSWGHRAWNTKDLSRNVWWMSVFTFGDSWHNNHHAFENSARVGLEWWEFDPTWHLVKTLELFGLATEIKLPSEKQKQYMAFENGIKKSETLTTRFASEAQTK